jgi:hypothetical protein
MEVEMSESGPEQDKTFEEKDEKDEKEVDKHDEKTVEEKWRSDPIGAVAWAAILIWAGLVLLADNLGLLERYTASVTNQLPRAWFPTGSHVWIWILVGAGVIVLAGVVVRLLIPAYRRPVGGSLVLAAILISGGLSLIGWNFVWPVVLIALGLAVLLRGFGRRR